MDIFEKGRLGVSSKYYIIKESYHFRACLNFIQQ